MKNNIKTFTTLNITDREDRPTLWVFGCSHSFGVGLRPEEKTYGILLAEHMNMPLKLVAKPATSTFFSLRHLVNAEIHEGDIVVWQLSTIGRLTYYTDGEPQEILLSKRPERRFVEFYTDDQLFFQQISLLNIGTMFLRAKKVKFVLHSIFSGQNEMTDLLTEECLKYPEFCDTAGCDVDFGYDNVHAGPITHQNISHLLYNHIQSTHE